MNNFYKHNNNNKRFNIVMLLLFVLLSHIVVGQNALENRIVQGSTENSEIVNNAMEINVRKQEAASNTSNMNFVLWFMGSKQSPNANIVPVGTTAKKQFLTSGSAPNRLLIKAFLKKAVNFERATA